MNIFWLATAERDLDALTDYIAEDNPNMALKIFDTIRQSVKKLATFPHIGREGRVQVSRSARGNEVKVKVKSSTPQT